jgi:DNA-binding HxlR family transcriptional regulator
MRRTSFAAWECPAARALESVGDWWSILILRDAFRGLRRFDEFLESLGVAPNMLARRLKHLTDEGLFERRVYAARPVRYEYVLTPKGRDFFPVLMALFAWGNRHLGEDERAFLLGDPLTNLEREPVVIDARTGDRITPGNTVLMPGPAASAETLHVIEFSRARRAERSAA